MDAYRAGFNRGSADKLSRRVSNDAVPPKYRTSDKDRRAFKKGYKEGYATPSRSPRVGAERELTSSEAIIKTTMIALINDLITSGVSGDQFVASAKPIYDKSAKDADEIAAKYGRFDSAVLKKELGEIVYGKALELKASPESLATIAYMATSGQLQRSPQPTTSEARPTGFTSLLMPGSIAKFLPKTSTAAPAATKPTVTVAPSAVSLLATVPPGGSTPRGMTAKEAIAASAETPSWISSNWPWVAAGTVVMAAGGGYLYYRSRQGE